jgi:amino acid permease
MSLHRKVSAYIILEKVLLKYILQIRYGRLKDYADIGFIAFGKPGQFIGSLFSQLMLFLTPTIYMILASENISDMLNQYGFVWLDRRSCIWIIAIVIGVPFILVRNMKDVSFLR